MSEITSQPVVADDVVVKPDSPGPWAYVRALFRDKVTFLSMSFLLLLIFTATFPNPMAPYVPTDQSLMMRNQPPMSIGSDDGFPYLLGTDLLGRDILSRIIHGARVSLLVAFFGVVVSGLVGVVLGLIAGVTRGRTDDVIMRLADLQLGFPFLMLALLVLYAIGPSLLNMVMIFAIVRWPLYARVARSMAMSLREAPFVEAAKAIGCSPSRIMFIHVLPNMASPLIVLGTMEIAKLILAEATLSFLGLGIQPPESSWGLMVSEGRDYVTLAWWLVAFPGLTIFLTALSANLLAFWVRGISDPVQRARWLVSKKELAKAAEPVGE